MLTNRLERVLDDAVQRLGDGGDTQCASHRPCEHRRIAARRLQGARGFADDARLRRALAAAYAVERQHPSFEVVVPGVRPETGTHAGPVGVESVPRVREERADPLGDRGGDLWTLTYVSQAPHAPTTDELDRILEVSVRNNARLDITGVLQCDGTTFVQTLEGDVDVVAGLFGRISVDRRHRDVTILRSTAIPMRRYAEWSMALDRL